MGPWNFSSLGTSQTSKQFILDSQIGSWSDYVYIYILILSPSYWCFLCILYVRNFPLYYFYVFIHGWQNGISPLCMGYGSLCEALTSNFQPFLTLFWQFCWKGTFMEWFSCFPTISRVMGCISGLFLEPYFMEFRLMLFSMGESCQI